MPQAQRSRSGDTKLQSPLPQRVGRRRPRFPNAIVGSTAAANGDNTEPPAAIERNPNGVSVRPLQWALRLQQDAIGADGMRSSGSRQDRQKRNVGLPLSGRLVPVHVTRALPHTRVPREVDQQRATDRHLAAQPQEHYESIHHARRQSDARNLCVCGCPSWGSGRKDAEGAPGLAENS